MRSHHQIARTGLGRRLTVLVGAVGLLAAALAGSAPARAATTPPTIPITVTPSHGVAGLMPLVTSATRCPTSGGTQPKVAYRVTPSPNISIWAPVQSATRPDGTWSFIAIPFEAPDYLGGYAIAVRCTLLVDGKRVTTLTYHTSSFYIRKFAAVPTVSSHGPPVPGDLTLTGKYGCPVGAEPHLGLDAQDPPASYGMPVTKIVKHLDGSLSLTMHLSGTYPPDGTYRALMSCAPPNFNTNPAGPAMVYPYTDPIVLVTGS